MSQHRISNRTSGQDLGMTAQEFAAKIRSLVKPAVGHEPIADDVEELAIIEFGHAEPEFVAAVAHELRADTVDPISSYCEHIVGML